MEAEDKQYLNQQARSEVKQQVKERLLPDMPPQLKGIDFVFDERSRMIYATATAEKQLDAFVLNLSQTTGCLAEAADPEAIAAKADITLEIKDGKLNDGH